MKVCVGWPWRVVQGVSRVRSHRKAAASSPAARAARSKLCERRRVLTVGALLDDKRPDPGPDRGGNQFGLLPNVLNALLDVEVVGDGHDPGDGASDDGGSLQQGGQVGRGELGSHRSGW